MSSKLLIIKGKVVIAADLTPQDGGLMFDGEITLNIYNRYIVTGIHNSDVNKLVGNTVIGVTETSNYVIIKFEHGIEIKIELTDDAYTSPEAMQLRVPGNPIVIWT